MTPNALYLLGDVFAAAAAAAVIHYQTVNGLEFRIN